MKKILIILLLFTFISLTFKGFTIKAISRDYDKYILKLDFIDEDNLPFNFRKTTDLKRLENSNLDLVGLNKLNISGSSEFTKLSLEALKRNIDSDFPITVVDLRAEPHGFINGNAVNWLVNTEEIDENHKISLEQVTEIENKLLASIPLNKSISLLKTKNDNKINLIPTLVENEINLTKSANLNYFRIPVIDNKRPTDDMVDRFITFINDLPTDYWIHFHCDMGDGRTTTFMSMFDMIRNSNNIEFNNILKRQAILGNINLDIFDEREPRLLFLKNFYQYTRDNKDNFKTLWSEWIKEKNIEPYPQK